jgi:hypothetical protein
MGAQEALPPFGSLFLYTPVAKFSIVQNFDYKNPSEI